MSNRVIPVGTEEEGRRRRRRGALFNGVRYSATDEDQQGVLKIAMDFLIGENSGVPMDPVRFKFANGEILRLTTVNFKDFYTVWSLARRRVT